jgi:1-acyl-sn-glycerol-3-phosphate acyltransferase
MANHVSNLDPPALIPRIPGRTAAFAKRALFKLPIFGYCLKLGSFIPVDRTGKRPHRARERSSGKACAR